MTITDIPDTPQASEPEGALRKAYRRWFRRSEPTYEKITGNGSELSPYIPSPRGSETDLEPLAWVQKHKLTIPDRRRVKARGKEVAKHLPGMAIKFTFSTIPRRAWEEGVTPICRGCGKCALAYYNWVTSAYLADAHKDAEGTRKSTVAASRHKSHAYRIWASVFAACFAAGSMAWLYFYHFVPFLVVICVVLLLLDVLGRVGTEKKERELAPIHTQPLSEGMEYGQLSETIQAGLNETLGVDPKSELPLARVSGLVTYDWERGEFRQPITTYQDFEEKNIRYLERRIAAKPGSMIILQDPRVSTQRVMVVKYRDPFASVPSTPWVPPGTKSITEGCLLGVSQTDRQFLVHFAGVHVGVVAQSKGGKSEGVIASIIEAILQTHNAVPVGIDLTAGPLLPIYGKCIQKIAYTPEDAVELLDWLLDEKERRARILQKIAESDDPNDKGREWNADLVVKYNAPSIHVIVDELAQATKFDGTPRANGIDIRGPLEVLARTGAKHWITLITGQQKTGKSDSGSTGISSNIHTWLLGPCHMDDANEIFSPEQRKSGWAPHLLKSAESGVSPNDAGRVYVKAPGYGPDVYCSYRPLPEDELKRRRKMRLEMGIPVLRHCGEDPNNDDEIMDAEVVPSRPTLEALAAAMEDLNPSDGRLPSAMVIKWINERTGMEFTQDSFATALKKELGADRAPRTQHGRCKIVGGAGHRHYVQADIEHLMAGS